MLEDILVPVDGSDFAEEVLPLAVGIAKRADATIHLVQVHVTRGLPYYGVLAGRDTGDDVKRREDEEAALRKAAERLEAEGVSVRAELLDGPVIDALADYIADHSVGLVVMTTHGRGGLSRMWLGSVADRLVRASTAPVFLVRPGKTEPTVADAIREVLVPLDGSELAETALEPAARIAELVGAKLTLFQVYLYGVPPVQARVVKMRREGEAPPESEYLEGVATRLRERGLEVETVVETDYLPAPAILAAIEKRGVDLTVIATHGRGGVSRLAIGSVADKVMRAAPAPVMIVRAAK